ncbi:superoxide dismutase [Cu-Zn] SodC2 [Klebsiella pneumoniae]|uniref:superoxide dismutase family protein n=1 Tax=Klebsiella pneumoniae TaxID=573 RepID=UPI000BB0DB77|nr:superoxide dismutase family protein [Klebsiella pneumoniae]PBD64750.1 superoxide dismutase [Cu-Zn] SodC2 [Klebsiella pneumoniae]
MQRSILAILSLAFCAGAQAVSEDVQLNLVTTQGAPAMKEGKAVAAGAAGGHYDPQHTGKHEGPLGAGHLGDLPLLVVNDAGVADQPIIAPRLKTLAEVKGKALMVHVGGDNMADSPQPLGGGGERFACGVIK